MTQTRKTIPNFKSRKEEAKFFYTHDMADFQHEFKTVKAKFAKNLSEGITVRFDKVTIEKLRGIAHEKGVGPTTLARMWIMDQLRQQA